MLSVPRMVSETLRAGDSPRLAIGVTATLLVVIALLAGVGISQGTGDPALAQTQGDLDCDGTECIIWGFSPGTLHKINTCTGVITAAALWGAGGINTIAANPIGGIGQPHLTYSTPGGARSCTWGFPPGPLVACGAVGPGANGLAMDGPTLYAGSDIPPAGSLYDPTNLIGSGGNAYLGGGGADLVCDPTGQHGFMGEARLTGQVVIGALHSVNRANGAQTRPRPAAGRTTYSGLAYDGYGRLWGSTFVVGGPGSLDLINPLTGVGAPTYLIPPSILDLASDECNSCLEGGYDLGDAPDSTNHYSTSMQAYLGVTAAFPSVRDLATGSPAGPFHRLGTEDCWLGEAVSEENDADLTPDADLVTNIDPQIDASDRDGSDDGIVFPITLPPCQLTQFSYTIEVKSATRDRYTNVWFDFNRNGHWGDSITCVDAGQQYTVTEWAVQDQLTTLAPGVHTVTTPLFRSLDPDADLWVRIGLADVTAPTAGDGRGYDNGYEVGETEDYLVSPIGSSRYE